MINPNKVYRNKATGMLITPIGSGEGILSLDNEAFEELTEIILNPELEGKEKHIPIVEIEGDKVIVKVGSIEHPMEEDHYIQLIQLLQNEKVIYEKRLFPGEKPIAIFYVENTENLRAREFCNKHGLWSNQ